MKLPLKSNHLSNAFTSLFLPRGFPVLRESATSLLASLALPSLHGLPSQFGLLDLLGLVGLLGLLPRSCRGIAKR